MYMPILTDLFRTLKASTEKADRQRRARLATQYSQPINPGTNHAQELPAMNAPLPSKKPVEALMVMHEGIVASTHWREQILARSNRSHKDWRDFFNAMGRDVPCDNNIKAILNANLPVIVLANMPIWYKPELEKWNEKQTFIDTETHMRRTHDVRSIDLVKWDIYTASVKGRYDIIAVFDSHRPSQEMWKAMGLHVVHLKDEKIPPFATDQFPVERPSTLTPPAPTSSLIPTGTLPEIGSTVPSQAPGLEAWQDYYDGYFGGYI